MRKFLLFLLLILPALGSGPFSFAQWVGPISITATQCASIGADANATVVMYATGTWTGTLQPQGTIQGQAPFNVQATPSNSSTAQATITANGAYVASVAGYSTFQLCGATVASGTAVVYLNASMRETGSGGGGAAATVPFSGVLPGTNTGALQVGTGGSLFPSGDGQIVATQLWNPSLNLLAPTLTSNATGGNLLTNHGIFVKITYNTALGESLPSIEGQVTATACTGGNQCSITVTAPTLPAGYTGYTVYSCDNTAGCVSGNELRQTAANNCVNIVANCVIQTVGAGAAVPTVNTAYAQPFTFTNLCPAGIQPVNFFQRADGTWVSLGGVDDVTAGPLPTPVGTWTLCNRLYLNDTSVPIFAKNGMFSIYHTWGVGTTTTTAADDRAFIFRIENRTTDSGAFVNSRIQGIYGEVGLKGTVTQFGSGPDQGQDGARFVLDDAHTGTGGNSLVTPSRGVTGSYQQNSSGTYASCSVCAAGVVGQVQFQAPTNNNSAFFASFDAQASNGGAAVGTNVVDYVAEYSSSGLFGNHWGLWIRSGFQTTDWSIVNDSNAPVFTNTNIFTKGIQTSGPTITGNGSIAQKGSYSAAQLTQQNITGIGNTGVAGATSYSYVACAKDGNGGIICSAVNTTNTGNAILSGSNFNAVGVTCTQGVTSYDFYRTASAGTPATVGLIGNLPVAGNLTRGANGGCGFNDTGLAADGKTFPQENTTGGITAAGPSHLAGNMYFVAADFTTAGNTSLQTITGLVAKLSPQAANYGFHCALSYSQATAVVAVAFGIQAAETAPTNIFATGDQQITVGPPATYVSATLATLTTTTATAIVSGTPGAIATNYTVKLDGTIEAPASSAGNSVNFMVSTANAGDLVTVRRGSYCQIF